jgi:hypothetical protein
LIGLTGGFEQFANVLLIVVAQRRIRDLNDLSGALLQYDLAVVHAHKLGRDVPILRISPGAKFRLGGRTYCQSEENHRNRSCGHREISSSNGAEKTLSPGCRKGRRNASGRMDRRQRPRPPTG